MKNYKNPFNKLTIASLALIGLTLFISCSNDDEPPVVINEEEVITTMKITLTASGANDITLQSQDLDGDGPEPPVITVSSDLMANTSYSGTIQLLNETESPAEDITTEVKEEDDEHQFFFSVGGSVSEVTYSDEDGNGNPLGVLFMLNTGDAGSGTLQVTLRHEPKKPNDGTLADAGGETDIAQSFSVTVQ